MSDTAAAASWPRPSAQHTPVFRDVVISERRAVWKGFLTGALAAVAAGVVTHPVDLVKVRLQLQGGAGEAAAAGRGLLGTAAAIVRSDGVKGLYAGLSGSVLRQSTLIGARIGVFDALKARVAAPGEPLSFGASVGCGLAAGAASAALCNPADLVLVRMQADGRLPPALRRNYAHAGAALSRIAREEGVPALWRGTAPTMARACVVAAAQMTFYDAAKAELVPLFGDVAHTHALASLAAGGAAAVASNPFDVVKTRLQSQTAGPGGAMPYAGLVDCFAKTAAREGPLALYKGLLATWARQAPLNTVRFVALEQLRRLIG